MDSPSPLDRILRTTTLIAFFPALGLLIPYGIVSTTTVPALGIIPAFFSATFGLLSLKHIVAVLGAQCWSQEMGGRRSRHAGNLWDSTIIDGFLYPRLLRPPSPLQNVAGIIPSITRIPAEKPRHSRESEALYQPLDASKYDEDARVSSEAGTLYRPSVDTLGSTETVVKLI
ncbi:hypothetical protein KCU73_g1535, partial [Aureobasidium melanogenum]